MTRAFIPQHCYEIWEYLKRNPNCKGKRCIYAEVLSKNLTEPYISICVKDPSDDCRVSFRGAEPWRITGYHVAGMGSAVVRCGDTELKIELACIPINDHVVNTPPLRKSYSGPTDIAIRMWWDKCVRITFDNKSYCICPQPPASPRQQGKRRGLREIIGKWFREMFSKLRLRHKVETKAKEHTSPSRRGDAAEK